MKKITETKMKTKKLNNKQRILLLIIITIIILIIIIIIILKITYVLTVSLPEKRTPHGIPGLARTW